MLSILTLELVFFTTEPVICRKDGVHYWNVTRFEFISLFYRGFTVDGVINGHSIHTGHTINVDVSQDSNCGKILPSAPDHRPESKTLSSYIISGLERSAVAVARKLLSLVLYLRMMFAGKDVQGMQPLTSDQKAKANRILDQIENELINSLNKQSIDSVRNNINKTFMTLGLLDENKQCVIRRVLSMFFFRV